MLKELGYVAKNGPYEVYITGIGNKSTAINLLRNHCGYSLQEAKAMCENLPATASRFNTRADAEALRKAIVTAGGGAIVLADASIKPVQADETRGYEVVLLGVGASKANVAKALRAVCGVTLVEASKLCSSAPVVIATDKTQSEAEAIAAAIESVGGSVQVNAPKSAQRGMQVQKNAFNVVLTSVGTNRLNVVKAVRDACGLGLGVANDLTKNLPAVIATGVSSSDAQTIRTAIENAGGAVRIE